MGFGAIAGLKKIKHFTTIDGNMIEINEPMKYELIAGVTSNIKLYLGDFSINYYISPSLIEGDLGLSYYAEVFHYINFSYKF